MTSQKRRQWIAEEKLQIIDDPAARLAERKHKLAQAVQVRKAYRMGACGCQGAGRPSLTFEAKFSRFIVGKTSLRNAGTP